MVLFFFFFEIDAAGGAEATSFPAPPHAEPVFIPGGFLPGEAASPRLGPHLLLTSAGVCRCLSGAACLGLLGLCRAVVRNSDVGSGQPVGPMGCLEAPKASITPQLPSFIYFYFKLGNAPNTQKSTENILSPSVCPPPRL